MAYTNEFYEEICQLIELARNINPQITCYVKHCSTLHPSNGFAIEIEGNRRLFISRYVLQDYAAYQSISAEDIQHIAESLKPIEE